MHIVRKVKDANSKEITCGIMKFLTNEKDFKDMEVNHITITSSTKEHHHKKLTEVYFVLKGSIDVEIDGKVEHLEEGSLIMIFPNTKHKAKKTSKENTEILVICSPPWSEDDEILED